MSDLPTRRIRCDTWPALMTIAAAAKAYRAALVGLSAAIRAGEGGQGITEAERLGNGLDDALAAIDGIAGER